MKKKLTSILCVVLALCTLLCTGAMAAELPNSGPTVRVNGQVVSFPDGQPFIDNNGRTMIPVRFVTEQLGATVTWDGKTQTANITKNGIKVAITIGNADMKVTKNSKTDTVKMDTAAVLKDGRTYVPIRFVAEALGAVVDYSEVYQTVGIYADKLTAEQITMLRELPYTTSVAASGYEAARTRKDAESLKFFYGTDRDSFKNFANAREHLYAYTQCKFLDYDFAKLNKHLSKPSADAFFKAVVDEAIAETNYQSERLIVTFIADTSCIYQEDNVNNNTCAVRGIVKARLNVKPTDLEGYETAMLCRFGFDQLYKDVDLFIPVDVHMNTITNAPVGVNTFVSAGAAY